MSAREDLTKLAGAWDRFWFQPASPVPVAIFRILLGLVVLQCLLIHLLPEWYLYFGDHGCIPIEDMIGKYWGMDPYFDLMLLMDETWRWYFFWFAVAMTVMMTLGLFTRVTAVLTFLCLMSLQHHFLLNQNAGDNYLRLCCLFVALSNCGDAFSLDSLIKSLRQDWRVTGFLAPLSAPWAQRLIQVQIAIAYGHTWFCKIDGVDWNNGTAVYFASRYDDIMRFSVPVLLDNLITIKLLTWGTLVVELALFTLIWWRPARYWVLLSGIALHLGIEWTMNLPMFEWLFMFTYFLFIYPEDLQKAWDIVKEWVHKHIAEPIPVFFDGACIVCVRTAGLAHRLDIFGLLDLVDFRTDKLPAAIESQRQRLESEMLIRTAKGDVLGGFEAFRYMTGRLPLLIPLCPFLYLPGISHLGSAIYKMVAANRFSILGGRCSDATCETATT